MSGDNHGAATTERLASAEARVEVLEDRLASSDDALDTMARWEHK